MGQSEFTTYFQAYQFKVELISLKLLEDIPSHFQHQVVKKTKFWRNSVSKDLKNMKNNKSLTSLKPKIYCGDHSMRIFLFKLSSKKIESYEYFFVIKNRNKDYTHYLIKGEFGSAFCKSA